MGQIFLNTLQPYRKKWPSLNSFQITEESLVHMSEKNLISYKLGAEIPENQAEYLVVYVDITISPLHHAEVGTLFGKKSS
jgi:hypothetical protein